jgi:hypothetical protein
LFGDAGRGGIERLQRIFEFRNAFVHEIGIEISGSYVMRDTLSPGQALEWCRFAIGCIEDIESQITTHAPTNFPNCLDERGYAKSDVEALDEVIMMLEEEISRLFEQKDRGREHWLGVTPITVSDRGRERNVRRALYSLLRECDAGQTGATSWSIGLLELRQERSGPVA